MKRALPIFLTILLLMIPLVSCGEKDTDSDGL